MGSAYLQVMLHGREERRYPLERDVVRIGRAEDNDLAISDLSLSREHAWVVRRDRSWSIADRGSRNGTLLNNQRVAAETPLKDGDTIRLGETSIVYHDEEESGVRLAESAGGLMQGSISIPAAELLNSTFRGAAPHDARLIDVMSRASRVLLAKADAAEIYEEVLEAAIEASRAERGALLLLEGDPPDLVSKATKIRQGDQNLVLSRTITRTVVEQRSSVITTDAQLDPRFDEAASVSIQGIRAAMCAPLWHDEAVAGVLYVDRRFSARQFTETDLAILTVLANLTAAKIQNLKLLAEAQAKRKLEEEMALAADIQKNLLPREAPKLPGWEFSGISISSRSVGGDLFDYIFRPGGTLGLTVADVSGKGMSAALLMASLQANLRAFAHSVDNLAQMMAAINQALHSTSSRNKFATVFFAELNTATGQASYVNAGHNPAVIIRKDKRLEKLSIGGMIVGSFPHATYKVGEFSLEPGDTLVLFSDGVTEAFGPDEELFGDERFEETLVTHAGESASELRDAVLEAVHTFTRGGQPSDDTTLLIARRL